jgi:hypothetical protein
MSLHHSSRSAAIEASAADASAADVGAATTGRTSSCAKLYYFPCVCAGYAVGLLMANIAVAKTGLVSITPQ